MKVNNEVEYVLVDASGMWNEAKLHTLQKSTKSNYYIYLLQGCST